MDCFTDFCSIKGGEFCFRVVSIDPFVVWVLFPFQFQMSMSKSGSGKLKILFVEEIGIFDRVVICSVSLISVTFHLKYECVRGFLGIQGSLMDYLTRSLSTITHEGSDIYISTSLDVMLEASLVVAFLSVICSAYSSAG
ncbi:hypothetical protein Leryth_022004 [Lithospermum erythrorhizon]|nr:hypothetical protein Leryth_022004 [Lithospermum erythrorhizon]